MIGCALPVQAAGLPPADPLARLEAGTRAEVLRDYKAFKTASAAEQPGLQGRLKRNYRVLHDLRNRKAFIDLWKNLGWKEKRLSVLYLASGSHLAPLSLLATGPPLDAAEFIYTDIDPLVPERVGALLRRMEGEGLSDLRESPWNGGREFRFHFGRTAVSLRVAVETIGAAPGVPPSSDPKMLRGADVVVTHDWSGDPRDNLAILFTIVETACSMEGGRPPFVFMEDLERHPYAVDLTLFNPKARTGRPYGHREHARSPDGTRLEAEDGPPLFGGGIALAPDWNALCALGDAQRETLFDTLLFSGQLFDRGNVDIVGGVRLEAPALLDLGTGFGYRDIRGARRQGEPGYLSALASRAAALLGPLRAHGMEAPWCRILDRFMNALKRAAAVDADAWLAAAAERSNDQGFPLGLEQRQMLKEMLANQAPYRALKEQEQMEALPALQTLKTALSSGSGCIEALRLAH